MPIASVRASSKHLGPGARVRHRSYMNPTCIEGRRSDSYVVDFFNVYRDIDIYEPNMLLNRTGTSYVADFCNDFVMGILHLIN